MLTNTPPPTRSSHPSPTATRDKLSNAEKCNSVDGSSASCSCLASLSVPAGSRVPLEEADADDGRYAKWRELLPNVISGRGRLSDFSALMSVHYIQLSTQAKVKSEKSGSGTSIKDSRFDLLPVKNGLLGRGDGPFSDGDCRLVHIGRQREVG